MKEEMLRLQVNSLVGGHMVRCAPHEVAAAEKAGAVAVLPGLADLDDPTVFLEDFLARTSIHPLCLPADYQRYAGIYERFKEPGYFVVAEPGASLETGRSFLRLNQDSDLEHLVPSTLLTILRRVDLLPRALQRRDAVDPEIPVYCEAATEEEALEALAAGADGTVVPSSVNLADVFDRWLADLPAVELDSRQLNIGVVALQGDFRFHMQELEREINALGPQSRRPVRVVPIQQGEDLQRCDAALLPGGWSNLQTLLYRQTGVDTALRQLRSENKPILGICAGMILAGARNGLNTEHRTMLELIDVTVDNNILNGSDLAIEMQGQASSGGTLTAAFSNGPVAHELGKGVEVLARIVEPQVVKERGECVVAARQGNVFIASCHRGPGTHDVFLDACLAGD